jgi:hypothetical protein
MCCYSLSHVGESPFHFFCSICKIRKSCHRVVVSDLEGKPCLSLKGQGRRGDHHMTRKLKEALIALPSKHPFCFHRRYSALGFSEKPRLLYCSLRLVYVSGKASCSARFAAATSIFFSESHSKARGTGKTRGISKPTV